MADDIMDDSLTRRGKPCWYRLDHVQKIAVNDALMVEMFVWKVGRLRLLSSFSRSIHTAVSCLCRCVRRMRRSSGKVPPVAHAHTTHRTARNAV